MSEPDVLKPLSWAGSSRKDFRAMPRAVQSLLGYALYVAQRGGMHENAKPLKGYGGSSLVEAVSDYRGDTYRCVYTIRIANTVYVLHAFQKKSIRGRATPRPDIALIDSRLQAVLKEATDG